MKNEKNQLTLEEQCRLGMLLYKEIQRLARMEREALEEGQPKFAEMMAHSKAVMVSLHKKLGCQ